MRLKFIPFVFVLFLFCQTNAQVITFTPTTTGTGFLPPNNSSGGISFLIQNTNPFPAILTSLSYFSSTAVTRDYVLWYAPTTVSMPATFPLSVAGGWNPISSITGVAMAGGTQTTIFPILSFTIPANTAYRFYLTSSNVQYTGTGVVGGTSGVSPLTFSNTGVNLMVAEAQFAGQNVGWGGGNFSPRAFLGTVTLNLLSSPCAGQPTSGTATASPVSPCPGVPITLQTTGATAASALLFQWQRSSTGAAPWITITGATTNPYMFVPPPTGFYRCIVTCSVSGLSDTTNITSQVVVQPWSVTSPCYCNSIVTSTTNADIGRFTLGTFTNPALLPTPQSPNPLATGTYTSFLSATPIPNVLAGLSYPISIYHISSTLITATTTAWVKVWIDFNHNSVFTDPNEEVFSSVSDSSNLWYPQGNITIPTTSLPGNTRMRVKLQLNGNATLTTPCNNITQGEVEDYLINISPAGPHDPTVSSIATPLGNNCTDSTELISATVCNYGNAPVDLSVHPYYITYKIYGPLGLTTVVDTINSGILPSFGTACSTSTIPPINMFAGGNYYINAVVSCPTLGNNFLSNDSLSTAILITNYRPQPAPPYNLCQYASVPFGQGIGVSGCSAPLLDTLILPFNIAVCADNIGSTGNGTAVGLPGNCSDQYACSFGTAIMQALPPGATFTQPAKLTVTNLSRNVAVPATSNAQVRFNLYKNNPVGTNLLSAGGTVSGVVTGGTQTNYDYQRNISIGDLSNIFSGVPVGSPLSLGYWESNQHNITLPDIEINSGAPSTATLTIYYQYVPPAYSWFDVPTLGTSLYSLSPFDPLSYPNAVVNNSNVPGTYTFYAACLGLSDCRIPVELKINPTPTAHKDTLTACEYLPGANNAIFDFTELDTAQITGGDPNAMLSLFYDQSLNTPISSSSDTLSSGVIYSKVFYPLTECYDTDSIILEVITQPEFSLPNYFGYACAPNSIDISSLISIFSPSTIDTLFYDDQTYTGSHPNPHAIFVKDTVYMVILTADAAACKDSAIAYIDITPATNNIANHDIVSNISIAGPVGCGNITLNDGDSATLFTTSDCRKVATVKDSLDLNALGSVSICEEVAVSAPFYNTQPYVKRAYEITPTNNGKAKVCLYYLQDDFDDLDATGFPVWPSITPNANLCITQVDNGILGAPGSTAIAIPNSAITTSYDASTTVWTVCFPVDSFSYFYCHTCNPANAALPVSILSFTANRVNENSELKWVTSSEQNNSHFVVQRSADSKEFKDISNPIVSKAIGGNSSTQLQYLFNDVRPLKGNNYYRLQQVDIDGNISYSGTAKVYFGDETMVNLYPNPVNTELNVSIQTPKRTTVYIKIVDATGRLVKTIEMPLYAGNNMSTIDMSELANGVYMVNVSNNKGIHFVQAVRKK